MPQDERSATITEPKRLLTTSIESSKNIGQMESLLLDETEAAYQALINKDSLLKDDWVCIDLDKMEPHEMFAANLCKLDEDSAVSYLNKLMTEKKVDSQPKTKVVRYIYKNKPSHLKALTENPDYLPCLKNILKVLELPEKTALMRHIFATVQPTQAKDLADMLVNSSDTGFSKECLAGVIKALQLKSSYNHFDTIRSLLQVLNYPLSLIDTSSTLIVTPKVKVVGKSRMVVDPTHTLSDPIHKPIAVKCTSMHVSAWNAFNSKKADRIGFVQKAVEEVVSNYFGDNGYIQYKDMVPDLCNDISRLLTDFVYQLDDLTQIGQCAELLIQKKYVSETEDL